GPGRRHRHHRVVRLHRDLPLPQPGARRRAGAHPGRPAARHGDPLPARAAVGGDVVIDRRTVRRRPWSQRVERTLLNLASVLLGAFILAPFAWMLISSLAGEAELTPRPPIFVPSPPP